MRALASALLALVLLAGLPASCPAQPAAMTEAPPHFDVPLPQAAGPVTFVAYGDTRFTRRNKVANALVRRALVAQIAHEQPAAIFIGGDLVFEGSDPDDYAVYHSETREWSEHKLAVFPALGNHELRGCAGDRAPCLENWWNGISPLALRPHRWYSVTIGSLLALVLDSDASLKPGSGQMAWLEQQLAGTGERIRFVLMVLHYPPVRDPLYLPERDEAEIERYLSRHAASLHARVVVIGSHLHNYERYQRNGVIYLVSGGGGAKPHPALRAFGELSQLTTAVNFHYLRFTLDGARLTGTMVRFDPDDASGQGWSEPDRFEVDARP